MAAAAVVIALTLAACSDTAGVDPGAATPRSSESPDSSPADAPERSALDGVYQAHLTAADAVDLGLSGRVRQDIADTFWTMNLSYEYAQMHYSHVQGQGFCCDGFIGSFEVDGRTVVFADPGGDITLRWRKEGERVVFTMVDDAMAGEDRAVDEYVFTSSPWTKSSS